MKRILFACLLILITTAGYSQTTYYWVGGTASSGFTSNANWNTALNGSGSTRAAVDPTDILIINGTNIGGTVPTTGSVTATITSTSLSQLKITGNATVFFQRATGGGGTGTMTIGGNIGDDFVVDAGSSLTLNSPIADGSVVIALSSAATGLIAGNISVSNTAQNRLQTQATGSLVFTSGSNFSCNITPSSSAYPLGSNSQSVEKGTVFLAGANLIYLGGFSPMGGTSTFSAADMRPGSNWYHRANNGSGSFFNTKSFGNIFVENGAALTCDGPVYRIGNLVVNSGCTFTTHTSGQTAVFGDLTVNGTYVAPAGSSNVLVLAGSTLQTISGSGSITVPSLVVADNSSAQMNKDMTVLTAASVYGKLNFNNSQLNGAGSFTSRVNNTAVTLNGNLTAGSYQITGVTGVIGGVNGLTVTGTGIPANTSVVGFSATNSYINLSQPVTASGTNVALAFLSDTAILATGNANGLDSLTGSVIVIGAKTFQSGTNYIINGATTKPFGITTGSTANSITTGFVDINAAVTVNRSFSVNDHLGINDKLTLRPLDTVHILQGGVINGAFGNTNYIATIANAGTGDQSIVQYDASGGSAFTVPIGTANYYLPATLTPATASVFTLAVFQGITSQGTITGTPLSPAQKQTVVDAVWNINRLSGTGSSGLQLGWNTALEGSTFTTLPGTDIGIIYNNGTSYSTPIGSGNNNTNIVTGTVSNFGSFGVGAIPSSQPFVFNAIPAKVYGNVDFNGGATSLNTTQPIVYSSNNPAVAAIVAGNIHIVGAGTADITASQAGDGFYPAASVTKTLTVSQAPLTVKADDKTKFEGQVNPALTVTYTGFVLGETAAVLSTQPTVITTATTASTPGTYPITVTGTTAANYLITQVNGTMTVQAKTNQTISFNAPATKTYGNADFAHGATSTNATMPITFVSSNPAVATIIGNNIHIVGAGTTNITASQAGSVGYFAATDVTRTLTVNKAALAIKVRDTVRNFGDANPPFTLTYTGFVLGETAANLTTPVTVVTTATQTSAPGYYVLTAQGAVTNNYTITYTTGTLTVLPATGNAQSYINAYMSSSSTLVVRLYTPKPALADIILYNMAGQPMKKMNIFMPAGFINATIDISQLPSGIYGIRVLGNGVGTQIDLKRNVAIVK
ncbi:MAG: MBG domain-containing protein [Ferruginibacter sp.]